MSATVEIYTSKVCPYCDRAKNLLKQKGVDYKEIDVSDDRELLTKMIERANGMRTVPQIFINDEHIGGSDDLYDLERQGSLDEKLGL